MVTLRCPRDRCAIFQREYLPRFTFYKHSNNREKKYKYRICKYCILADNAATSLTKANRIFRVEIYSFLLSLKFNFPSGSFRFNFPNAIALTFSLRYVSFFHFLFRIAFRKFENQTINLHDSVGKKVSSLSNGWTNKFREMRNSFVSERLGERYGEKRSGEGNERGAANESHGNNDRANPC